MAVTVASFKAQYREFAKADDAMVQAYLNDAALLAPASVWGSFADQYASLKAAQAIALSPAGREMQLTSKDGSTVYDSRISDLESRIVAGAMVL